MGTHSDVKSWIIEYLFQKRWDHKTQTLSRSIVTFNDIADARQEYSRQNPGTRQSVTNEANFFKDFIRRKHSANARWPSSILKAGYTARQTTGGGYCFEFVPLAPGQTVPFPITITPSPKTPRHTIETVTLPLTARRLGRREETWVTQVVVRHRVVETHLAVYSPRRNKIIQVEHLQMSVKRGKAEIDALFVALENGQQPTTEVLVCCEVKGPKEDLIEEQILQQARAVFSMKQVTQNTVIPLGIKVVGPSEIYVVEFDAIMRHTAQQTVLLQIASEAVYKLHPPVPGIG